MTMPGLEVIGSIASIAQVLLNCNSLKDELVDLVEKFRNGPQILENLKERIVHVSSLVGSLLKDEPIASDSSAKHIVNGFLEKSKAAISLIESIYTVPAKASRGPTFLFRTKTALQLKWHQKAIENSINAINQLKMDLTLVISILNLTSRSSNSSKTSLNCPGQSLRWNLPPLHHTFIGRDTSLSALNELLQSKKRRRRAGLVGLPGIGKSTIALQFVETFQKLNPSVSIFWIEAGSVSQLEQNCFKIIDDIGLERPNGSQPGLVDLKSWFDSIESGDWLIVYDGVDSQSSLYGEHQLHKYIPRFSRGAIIFTSRNKQVIVDLLDSSAIVQVDGMPSDDAENLLLNRSGNSPHLSKHISELLLKLEYIPWAIIQAASFIAKNCISIDGYFEYYTKDEAQRIQLLNRLFPNVMSQADFKSAIETWFMSFKIIEDENEAAISLLSYLAMIDKDRIPTFILPEEHNALEQTVALGLLRSHSMLIVDPKTGLLYLNGLARMFMREYLRSRNLFEQYHNKAQLYLLQQYPESFTQTSDFIKGKVIIHHVKSTYDVDTRQCVRMETMNTPLLLSLADHLFRIGQYNSALEYANFLISITRDFDGVENNDQAAARNVVGLCHMHLAEFKKAKLEFELGIDCAENGTLMHDKIRNGIGWLSYLQGAYESAADIFQSILKTEGDESSDREVLRQDVLTNYGLTKQAQGQLNKAETALREVLDRRQATQSSGFTKTIDAYSNLATILQRKRQWKEALFYHCEVLRKRLEFLDENNHDCLRSRANIALVLVEQGDLQASEPILLGLLEEFSNILGLNHPETLNLKNNIVNILHQRSLFNEAVCLGKDVLAGRIKTLGHSHPDTVIIHDYCDRMDAWRKEQGLERTNEITVL